MNQYDYYTHFSAYAYADERPVEVSVYFNLEVDDLEYLEGRLMTLNRTYSIELGPITAIYSDNAKGEIYEPTEDDLKEWKLEMEKALKKVVARQIA